MNHAPDRLRHARLSGGTPIHSDGAAGAVLTTASQDRNRKMSNYTV
jgi:hypothetical protein